MSEKYSLVKETDKLRKLILENPDLPIVVLVGQDTNCGDYRWTYCSEISFGIGEILDCDFYDYDDVVFTDRDRLEEYIEDIIFDPNVSKTAEEWDKEKEKRLKELEPYWKKVIEIKADN